jgi:hypothetical protein
MFAANLFELQAIWFFQKTSSPDDSFDRIKELDKEKTDFNRIRCPLCQWQPQKSDRWMCADGGEPEYYYNACYTSWNTFETGGRCPGCNHQWRWTTCLSCHGFSRHEAWYVNGTD